MKWEWQQTRVYLIDNGYRYGYALKSYSYKIWEIEYTGQWIKKSNDKDDLIILIDTIKEHGKYNTRHMLGPKMEVNSCLQTP